MPVGVTYDELFVKVAPHPDQVYRSRIEQKQEHELRMRRRRYQFTEGMFNGAGGTMDPMLERLLLARMAERPEDTDYVINVIRSEAGTRVQMAVAALEALLAADQFQPWQLQRIRETVTELLGAKPGGSDEGTGPSTPAVADGSSGAPRPRPIEGRSRTSRRDHPQPRRRRR